ncbi:uncharacterized protein LOC135216156 [Macrobrachium nipponense]|uniref:uncharacterized protein LOC135216156 n=1 Tax=Macrobrachium nipponense TaxID=159736 RepID=UPI0030C7DC1A
MADEAARRRELRRRRILENAEERKRKIFGTSSSDIVDTTKENDQHKSATIQDDATSFLSNSSQKEEEGSSNDVTCAQDTRTATNISDFHLQNSVVENNYETEHNPLNFRTENGIDSVPEIAEHIRNINNLMVNSAGNSNFTTTPSRKVNSCDVQSATLVGALSTPIVPVILALFVCILLSVKLEYVVSNSIALPFLLWEAHHMWCMRHVIEASSQGVGGLLGLALVLCGVQQSAVRKMMQVSTIFRCVFEDFAFYILTVVIWYWIIGLPGSAHSAKDIVETENSFMSTASEDNTYTSMEEF